MASGVPVLGVCRGFQEMNVAFGGTLWQKVHEVPGLADHRENKEDPLEVQYGPAHEVELVPGGVLHQLAGSGSRQGEFGARAGRAERSAARSRSRRARRTAWSRPSACATRAISPWPCNGIPSGR